VPAEPQVCGFDAEGTSSSLGAAASFRHATATETMASQRPKRKRRNQRRPDAFERMLRKFAKELQRLDPEGRIPFRLAVQLGPHLYILDREPRRKRTRRRPKK